MARRGLYGGRLWWKKCVRFFLKKQKEKSKGLKLKRFIIIGIKNIFQSSVNDSRLMVASKIKTFGSD